LKEEHLVKKGKELDMSDWTVYTPRTAVPQQSNGYDCGVFCCQFAECCAAEKSFRFSQQNMPDYRKSMVVEILRAKLRTR
jgi:sentrin-specific protease 1